MLAAIEAVIALVLGWRRSAEISMAAGVALCAWIAMQVVVIVPEGGFSWLQPTMFTAGTGIAIAATRLKRGAGWSDRCCGVSSVWRG